MAKIINSFTKKYEFLSNFYPSQIEYEGISYPTVEHAFQAIKSLDVAEGKRIAAAKTPDEAKYIGRRVSLRSDWEEIKETVMRDLITLKFAPRTKLANKLMETGDAILVEGNYWHDNTWGNCTCGRASCQKQGKNLLGKILMETRKNLLEVNKANE